jgi:glucosamine-6-phosphate deaminase
MEVRIAATRAELGAMAARDIARALREKLEQQPRVRIIFAAAPSQSATLAALLSEPEIDWSRVIAFHMDEYLELSREAPQRFGTWLTQEFFRHVPMGEVHLIDPDDGPPLARCSTYTSLLREAPIDFVLLGIGTNGHLAFNDPPADLSDPEMVRVVALDEMCREQQVFDGCFPALDDVPHHAITLTVPTLLAGRELFCSVPGSHKSQAVKDMLETPISGACPATALRTHPRCTVYLDRESSSMSGEYRRD